MSVEPEDKKKLQLCADELMIIRRALARIDEELKEVWNTLLELADNEEEV